MELEAVDGDFSTISAASFKRDVPVPILD